MRTALPATTLLLALAATGGCRDTAGPAPVPQPAAAVAIEGGDGQSAPAGTRLPQPLAVRVVDADGDPVEGEPVAWSVEERGGAVDADGTRTGPDGIARARWTMGGFAGTWTATAQAGELPPVTFQATATGPVQVRILAPDDSVRTDSLRLEVEVLKDARPVEVVASTADRSVVLERGDGDVWSGVLALDGLDRAAHEVVVTATNDRGKAAVAVLTAVNDARPTIRIVSPIRPFYDARLLAGAVPVTAVCDDDDPGGCELRIEVLTAGGATPLGSGRDSVTAEFSAVGYGEPTVAFRFVAADSGGETSVETGTFPVEPNPRWTEVMTFPGYVFDASPVGAVYYVDTQDETRFYRAADDRTFVINLATSAAAGRVTADGVIWAIINDGNGNPFGVQQLGGSNVLAQSACCIQVRGDWAGYVDDRGYFHRENVLSPGYLPPVFVSHFNENVVLAADGTALYAPWENDLTDEPHRLIRSRPGAAEEVLLDDTAATVGAIWGDEENVVAVVGSRTSASPSQLLVIGSEETEPLTTPGARVATIQVEDGWVAWATSEAGGTLQVWTRDPDGVRRQVTNWGSDSRVAALGPGGQVVVENNGRWHLVRPPYAAPLDIGTVWRFGTTARPRTARVKWVDGTIYTMAGTSVFRVDP